MPMPKRRIPITASSLATIIVGTLLATFAFAHAAASVGISIEPFRPLGTSFFNWKAGQRRLLSEIVEVDSVDQSLPVVPFSRAILREAPLSAGPAWLLGIGYESAGQGEKARRAMLAAERISRRDPRAQLWLAGDAFRREDVEKGLHHVDVVLRTRTDVSPQLLQRLASVLTMPEGREAMRRYSTAENPWLPQMLYVAATTLPSGEPLARFLIERGEVAPDGATERDAYRVMLRRLAADRQFALVRRVYPLLPGAKVDALESLSIAGSGGARDYPPIGWEFPERSGRGGTPLALGAGGEGIEFYSAPGVAGAAGTRIVWPGSKRRLRFSVGTKTTHQGASAHWVATCVNDRGTGAQTKSPDLMTVPEGRSLTFELPRGCPVVRLEMSITGGMGRTASSILIENPELVLAG